MSQISTTSPETPLAASTRAAAVEPPATPALGRYPAWFGFANGLATGASLAVALSFALMGTKIGSPLGWFMDAIVAGALGAFFVSSGGLVELAWKGLGRLVRKTQVRALHVIWDVVPLRLLGLTPVIVLFASAGLPREKNPLSFIALFPLAKLLTVLFALAGGLLGWARVAGATPVRNVCLAATVLLNVTAFGWLAWPGPAGAVSRAALTPAVGVAAITAEDPRLAGPFTVKTLTYGSGTDQRRPEYAGGVALATPVVDATPIHPGPGGLAGAFDRWYWGFDYSALPLNARVWYPDGAGPFPLFVIVHGAHAHDDFSDPGYAYLGEHLAGRGLIVVSVDENFLGGNWLQDLNGVENPLRGWLLLKHLELWRSWNAAPGNPFYGRVDLERIALGGHSRGGEAVAHAALINTAPYPPVAPVTPAGGFGFNVRALVALAPIDGQYRPEQRDLRLEDVSYLWLGAGHDADTFTAYGLRQFNRVRLTDAFDGFKAAAYLYRGNHAQFNTVWGRAGDRGALDDPLFDRAVLLEGAAQRQAATVFITSFLEATLQGRDEYRAVFTSPDSVRAWLPDDVIVTQYQDAHFQALTAGEAIGFSAEKHVMLPLRAPGLDQQALAARLTWEAGAAPVYALALPQDRSPEADGALTFALATALEAPTPFSVAVELETRDGVRVSRPLAQFGSIHPPLPARWFKSDSVSALVGRPFEVATPYEIILQTYTLPLAAFGTNEPAFRPERVTAIRLRFQGAEGGEVWLDRVGMQTQ